MDTEVVPLLFRHQAAFLGDVSFLKTPQKTLAGHRVKYPGENDPSVQSPSRLIAFSILASVSLVIGIRTG